MMEAMTAENTTIRNLMNNITIQEAVSREGTEQL